MAKKSPPQQAAGYRSIPHTADAGFKLWGPTLADVFVQAAYALTSLMTDRRHLQNREILEVEVEASDQEILLVDWLNYVLYLYDTKSFFAKDIDVLEISEQQLKARLAGEELDPARHILKTGVKAATYHQLSIRRQDSGWEATVIFDL
jgi:SHS2 domain-containing protein